MTYSSAYAPRGYPAKGPNRPKLGGTGPAPTSICRIRRNADAMRHSVSYQLLSASRSYIFCPRRGGRKPHLFHEQAAHTASPQYVISLRRHTCV